MRLEEARKRAEALVEQMAPYCQRVEVAGSIRRQKPEGIKDIEVVATAKWEPSVMGNLFGEPELLNRLLVWAYDAESRGEVRWIKPGTSEVIPWEPKRDGKYWRGIFPDGVKLDLFLATPENFGLIYLIRTGSAEFSQAVVTHAKRKGWRSEGGSLRNPDGEALATPEEDDVFRLLGLETVAPEWRGSALDLRTRRQVQPC